MKTVLQETGDIVSCIHIHVRTSFIACIGSKQERLMNLMVCRLSRQKVRIRACYREDRDRQSEPVTEVLREVGSRGIPCGYRPYMYDFIQLHVL